MIEVEWVCDEDNPREGLGYEIHIPIWNWLIVVNVKDGEDSTALNDITIFDKNSEDVTETFLMFKDNYKINPTGINLFQIMDVLRTNMQNKEK